MSFPAYPTRFDLQRSTKDLLLLIQMGMPGKNSQTLIADYDSARAFGADVVVLLSHEPTEDQKLKAKEFVTHSVHQKVLTLDDLVKLAVEQK